MGEAFWNGLRITWNDRKSELNIKKHGFSLDDAWPAVADLEARYFENCVVDGEERLVFLGVREGLGILLVVFIYPDENNENHIHLISSWLADDEEKRRCHGTL